MMQGKQEELLSSKNSAWKKMFNRLNFAQSSAAGINVAV